MREPGNSSYEQNIGEDIKPMDEPEQGTPKDDTGEMNSNKSDWETNRLKDDSG